jgi:predicted alpha/beta-hydrolase family hydrolase
MADAAELALLVDGNRDAPYTIVLAHGASVPMDGAAMVLLAEGLVAAGMRVVRFEFPYMQRRRETGKGGAPDRPAVLEGTWHAAIEQVRGDLTVGGQLVIGGRSMGGRIASMIADAAGAAAVVCYGYPFHPPGRPEKVRTAHLAELRTPTLIVQGERDPFGTPDDVAGYALAASIRLHWVVDGDHSLKSRKGSGRTLESNHQEAVSTTVAFLRQLSA